MELFVVNNDTADVMAVIFFVALTGRVSAYYGYIPTWTANVNYGWGNPNNYMNYNSYQAFSDPYMLGPAMGVYYPYDTRFNIYNGAYNVNAGYNQNFLGFYNTGNYVGAGWRDIDSFGYPLPYAYVDQGAWNNQMSTATGFLGYPPMTANYINRGNPYNVYYDPQAFTMDLGIDAYFTGVQNFWVKVFKNLNEEEEED